MKERDRLAYQDNQRRLQVLRRMLARKLSPKLERKVRALARSRRAIARMLASRDLIYPENNQQNRADPLYPSD